MADTPTPNFGFKKPAKGDRDWDVSLNYNADLSDTTLKEHEDQLVGHDTRLDTIEADLASQNDAPDWVPGSTYPLAGTLVTHDFTVWEATENSAVNYFTTPRVEPEELPYVTALIGHGLIEFTWDGLEYPGTIAGGGAPDSILISALVDGQGAPVEFMVEKAGNLDAGTARIPTISGLPANNWATVTIAMYDSVGQVASAVTGEFMTIRLWLVDRDPEREAVRYWNIDWIKKSDVDRIDARVFDRALSRLSDAIVEDPQAGDVLIRKDGVWQNVSLAQAIGDAGVTTASSLAELTDLTLTNPQDGDVIKRVGGQWVNAPDEAGTGGGGSGGGSGEPIEAMLVPVRQTVLTGRTDVNGQANFLEAGTGLAVNLYASESDAIEIAFAAGFNAGAVDYVKRLTDATVGAWSGLAPSTTNFLYADLNPAAGAVTYGVTQAVPLYQAQEPAAVAAVKFHPNMTTNSAPGPYVASGSSESQPAWHAFNGDYTPEVHWYTTHNAGAWLALDMGEPQTVAGYAITPLISDRNYAPVSWVIEGRNEVGDWVVVDTRTSAQPAARTVFTLPAAATYRHFRIRSTAASSIYGTGIVELEFLSNSPVGINWFDLTEMRMKVGNVDGWEVRNRVFIGEAVTDGAAVTSVITYALQGRYDSGWFSVAASTPYTKSHNLGAAYPEIASFQSRKSDGTGPVLDVVILASGSFGYGGQVKNLENTNSITVVNSTHPYYEIGTAGATSAQYRLILNRGWGVGGGGSVTGTSGGSGGAGTPVEATLVPVRQTVLTGRTDTNGQANFLEAGTGLAVNLYASVANPLELAFASGFNEGAVDYVKRLTAGTVGAWSGLPTNATSYLYAELNPANGAVTYGFTPHTPLYAPQPLGNQVKYIVIEVDDFYASNGATLTEVDIYDGAGNPLTYTLTSTDVYDSAKNGPTEYWNTGGNWSRVKLFDNNVTYTDNATGATSSMLLLYPGTANSGKFARFLVTLNTPADAVTVKIWAGSPEGRVPHSISAYVVTGLYNFEKHLKVRTNEGLALLGTKAFTGAENTVQEYTMNATPFALPLEGRHWFDLTTFKMKASDASGNWSEVHRVFLGEALAGASSITSVLTYALQGHYDSGVFPISASTPYTKTHALGLIPEVALAYVGPSESGPFNQLQFWASSIGTNLAGVDRTVGKLIAHATPNAITGVNTGTTMTHARLVFSRGWGMGGGGEVTGSSGGGGTASVELFKDPVYWMGM